MIPFDYEIALAHPERVITRNGRKIEKIEKRDQKTYCLLVTFLKTKDDFVSYRESFTQTGKRYTDSNSEYDLFLTAPDPNERIKSSLIKVSTSAEFYELRGMFRAAGGDTKVMIDYWAEKSIWWWMEDKSYYDPYLVTGHGKVLPKDQEKPQYNSLADFLANKPASKDVRISLYSQDFVISEVIKVIDKTTGASVVISKEDWKKISEKLS